MLRWQGAARTVAIPMALAAMLVACGGDEVAVDPAAAAGDQAPKSETVEITGVDYAFEGVPDTVAAGTELTFTNASDAEAHEMVVMRINDDEERSIEELLALPEEEAMKVSTFAGVAVAPPGEDGFTPEGPVVLDEAGRYALLCFIPVGADPAAMQEAIESGGDGPPPDMGGGPPHFTEGMVAELTVE